MSMIHAGTQVAANPIGMVWASRLVVSTKVRRRGSQVRRHMDGLPKLLEGNVGVEILQVLL